MALFICLAVLVCLSAALLQWTNLRFRKKVLPPGTLGWPLFGETAKFLTRGPEFMKARGARYGRFFKSHVFGCPTVVSMDPDVNRYILMNESKGLVPGYPQSMLDIVGNRNIAAVHGSTHKYMRAALFSLINPAMIKDQILSNVDSFVRSHLASWEGTIVDIQKETKEMAFLSMLRQICGTQPDEFIQEIVPEFFNLVLGTLSLPINFPGTNYRCGVQARRNIVRMLRKLMEERRGECPSPSPRPYDMLDDMLRTDDEYKHKLSDEEIIDQIMTLLYSGYETVSTTSMMAVKYLHDNPVALHELRREHMEIRAKKKAEDPVDWNDFKSMKFTRAVIFETLRLATVVNGVLRKTTKDLELNGFEIPKGWRIYVYLREMNYDQCVYPEPLAFNPWRWLEKDGERRSNNLLFGGGTRVCPGKELGIAEISTFLHYFVIKYRWEEIGGAKMRKFPRVSAPNGLHIRVSSYSTPT
ncbi:hypothetical protein MLD38_001524 [Melastoma candidum]|uniref:Uncharacterized protein n=1 Tax=Melastoma candidum TaxID=119954 RepID=A0ACB9SIE7_9MYRT|nr:hypothetical protein MLD38_001524 [Melastoma candidum]